MRDIPKDILYSAIDSNCNVHAHVEPNAIHQKPPTCFDNHAVDERNENGLENKACFVEPNPKESLFQPVDNNVTPKQTYETTEIYGQKIINICDQELTQSEKTLLCKGLKFCPTPNTTDPGKVKIDLDKFHNDLRKKQFFVKNEKSLSNNNKCQSKPTDTALDKISPYGNTTKLYKLRQKSLWKPPAGSSNLETFANLNDLSLQKSLFPLNRRQNMSTDERKSLKTLSKDKELTI